MYITLDELKNLISKTGTDVFMYRKKNKNVKVYQQTFTMSNLEGNMNSYSFEINAFNLVRNCK